MMDERYQKEIRWTGDGQREVVMEYHPQDTVEPRFEDLWEEDELDFPPPERPMWKEAVDPPEGRRQRWLLPLVTILAVVLGLLLLIQGVALGWNRLWAGFGGRNDTYSDVPGDEYHWDMEKEMEDEESHLPSFPAGGSAEMLLRPAAQEDKVLSAGEIYEKVRPSTVSVLGQNGPLGSVGTGVILSEDGYIVTNYHVIAGCQTGVVLVTDAYGIDTPYDAKLVGGDRDRDLAVLKIDAQGLQPAEFGISDHLSVGDRVYAIGNPLGLELRATFTDGIVSAVNRDVDVDGVMMTLIQTNAALNSGNSGGPLINQYGQVVGVNTIKMMGGEDTVEGLGFAIPTSFAARWVNELIRNGEIQPEPILGLTINKIPEELPDGTLGLRIVEVTPGLGGEKAGIQVNDRIVAFNGRPVQRIEEILAMRRELHVGDEVPVRLFRNGEYLEVTMTLMASPD